jgi:uncharacterized protein YjeT (DUF2065 family)
MARPRWTLSERTKTGSALSFRRETNDPPPLADLGEEAVRVVAEVEEQDAVLHPGTDLQELDVGGALADKCEALRAVRPHAHQRVDLDARGDLPRPSRRPLRGEAGVKPHHRGVLDHDVLEGGELGVEVAPGLVGELAQRILQAPLQELRELGGEAEVEAGVAQLQAGSEDVPFLELLEMAVELDTEVEDEHPEEGDRSDLALPLDEAGLSSELDDLLGGEETDERLLDLPRPEWGGTQWARGTPRHPIEVEGGR